MKSWICSCNRKNDEDALTCIFCGAGTTVRVKEPKPLKRTEIKKRSDKRAAEERAYNKRVKEWLVGKKCAVYPWLDATQCHHRAGRQNELLMDETYWLAVSDDGHRFIHENSEYSRKMGYMVLRSVTEKKTI